MADENAAPRGSQRFPRQARVRRRPEFERLQKEGVRVHATPFVIVAFSAGAPRARLGLAISRKVGNSVLRNRLRRLVREVFRSIAADLPAVDLLVIARPDAASLAPLGREAVGEKLLSGLRRAADRADRSRGGDR